MDNDALIDILGQALMDAAQVLANRAREDGGKNLTAAEVARLQELYKAAGGTFTSSQGKPTDVGDSVLNSMAGLDAEALSRLQ